MTDRLAPNKADWTSVSAGLVSGGAPDVIIALMVFSDSYIADFQQFFSKELLF